MKKIVVLMVLCGGFNFCIAQTQPWKGKQCAVVLTYDDAIDEHLDNAAPLLDSLKLKATFYITAFSASVQKRLNDWKKLSVKGHELGNHTLYHPCIGGAGREWVKPEYDLRNYTVQRMIDETRMTNVFLQSLDGKKTRTFAFTCGDMKIGDTSFIDAMKKDFTAARAVRNQMHHINEIDLYNVDCYMVNNHSFEQMKKWVDNAMHSNSLLVILFHGVGGGNSLNVSLTEHRKLLKYIAANQKNIWVAPMVDIAAFIKKQQPVDKH